MCGIVGVVRHAGQVPQDLGAATEAGLREVTSRMLRELEYRGPDGHGIYACPDFAIGCARLQIVGGPAAQQPVMSRNGRMLLVCNGEVYSPDTPSPTSVSDCGHILDVYGKYGISGLAQIGGQFAFALIDLDDDSLILVRDRYGILPLYFAESNCHVWFASEIKSILVAGALTTTEMRVDVGGMLQSAVFYGPTPPRTCVLGIKQVPPGCVATWPLSGGDMRLERFAHPDSGTRPSQHGAPSRSPEENQRAFASALRMAVERRLRGEGGVAAYLSGGIDSSSILALAAVTARDKLAAFSLEFVSPEIDESHTQLSVASYLGVQRHALRVDLRRVLNYLPSVIGHTEVPITRVGPIPLFLLSRFVKQHGFKFALSGEGADELLLGYPYFQRGLTGVATKLAMWQSQMPSIFAPDSALQSAWPDIISEARAHLKLVGNCSTRTLRNADLNTKLTRYLLSSQGERVSYANSIELRYPYLDEELWSLLDDTALSGMHDKRLLRRSMGGLLPEGIVERPKRGYLAPVGIPLDAVVPDLQSPFWELVSPAECDRYGLFSAHAVSAVAALARSAIASDGEAEWVQSALLFVASTHVFVPTRR